jgi:hypothetical protein
MESYNTQGPYFRIVFGFIGITDVTIIHAGGTNKVAQGQVTEPRGRPRGSQVTRTLSTDSSKSGGQPRPSAVVFVQREAEAKKKDRAIPAAVLCLWHAR